VISRVQSIAIAPAAKPSSASPPSPSPGFPPTRLTGSSWPAHRIHYTTGQRLQGHLALSRLDCLRFALL
jgi:hypothetical protein